MATLNEIGQSIAEENGEDWTGDSDIQTQYLRWGQSAINDLSSYGRWFTHTSEVDFALSAGVRQYALTGVFEPTAIILNPDTDDPRPITRIPDSLVAQTGFDQDAYGTGIPLPRFWYLTEWYNTGIVIAFLPPPDDQDNIVRIIHQRMATQYAGDDALDLSPELENVVENRVRWYAALNAGRPDEAQLLAQAWKEAVIALSGRFSSPPPRGSRLPAFSRINEGGRLPGGGEVGE